MTAHATAADLLATSQRCIDFVDERAGQVISAGELQNIISLRNMAGQLAIAGAIMAIAERMPTPTTCGGSTDIDIKI